MRLSFTVVPVAFAVGTLLLQVCAVLPVRAVTVATLVLSLASGAAAVALTRIASSRRKHAASATAAASTQRAFTACHGTAAATLLAVVAALLAGFGYAALRAERRLADALPIAWENRDLRLRGVVDSLPQRSADGTRFAFAVEEVLTPTATVPRRLSLAWFAPASRPRERASATAQSDVASVAEPPPTLPEVHAGERWTLTLRLKRPHGAVNPHGFDLEAWLFERNLRATGYVRDTPGASRDAAFAGRASDYIERARESIRSRIAATLGEGASAGVLTALAIGDQDAVSPAQWQVFNRTGVTHLISISGLHVTVFAALAGFATLVLARRSSRLTLRVPARKLAMAIGVLAAWGYVLLAGAEVPAVRTLLMLAVAAVGLWLNRPGSAPAIFAWALAAVSIADPWASLAPGFWLSFGAVGLLLYACGAQLGPVDAKRASGRVRALFTEALHAQWVVTVGLVPGTLAWFQQVSLVSLAANAVAIPVVTFAVVPLALAGIAVPFGFPWQLAGMLLRGLLRWLEWLSAWPDAAWGSHAPEPWTLAAAVAGVLWIFAPRGVPGRPLGVMLMLPLVLVAPAAPLHGGVRVVVLDVGQGLAVLVETARHALLYDAGPRYRTGDAGARAVVPYLRASGVSRLDRVIVSHADSDHAGGVASVLAAVPVASLLSSMDAAMLVGDARASWQHATPSAAPPAAILEEHAMPPVPATRPSPRWERCRAGQAWGWDGVGFEILHPHDDAYRDARRKTNDLSCVLAVTSPAGRVLVTGDIEARSEAEILARGTTGLAADILVVPHHGSQTSSTPAFIAAVAPRVAAIAAGYVNRFGHPRPAVLERYRDAGASIERTDLGGALDFELTPGRELIVAAERERRRRYWYDRRRTRRDELNRRSARCASRSRRSAGDAMASPAPSSRRGSRSCVRRRAR